jgi:hypothetical protein
LDAARLVRNDVFNPQHQPKVVHQPSPPVARAYVDQLTRAKALPAGRASAIVAALSKSDRAQLDALATQLQQDAAAASGQDARTLKALAEVLKATK